MASKSRYTSPRRSGWGEAPVFAWDGEDDDFSDEDDDA